MITSIVTSYNKSEYLRECLDSILSNLNYNFGGLEIIIVDDQSTDASLDIANEYMSKYPDVVRVIVNEKNSGAGVSRQVGIDNAHGEWISFVDADDCIESDFYKTLYEHAEKNGSDIVYCDYVPFIGSEKKTKPFYLNRKESFELTDIKHAMLNMSYYKLQFLNVSITKKSLYDSGVKYCPSRYIEDTPTALQLISKSSRISVIPYEGYRYRQVSDSLIHSHSKISTCIYYIYNMIWAIERLSGVEESVVENLKMFFRDMIHTSCITYRWEEDDFIKEDSEMWDRIKTFYNVDPAVMKSNKEYSQKYTHYPKMKK